MTNSNKITITKEQHLELRKIAAPYLKRAAEFAEITNLLTFKSWGQSPDAFENYVGMPYDKMAMLVNSGWIKEDVLNEAIINPDILK